MAVSSAPLTFDPELHEYRVDGRVVPSVTRILHATGLATDFEAIAASSRRMSEAIEYRRALGTAVHADAHAYDDDAIDWPAVDPRVRPYVEAWAEFRRNTHLEPMARERRLFHPGFNYAGTLDGVFARPDGKLVLVDMKLGDPSDAGAAYQTAAYEAAYLVDHPDHVISERWAVLLLPERRIPYVITDYTTRLDHWRDFHVFQAAIAVYHAQPSRSTR
jgi:hypothetical protein